MKKHLYEILVLAFIFVIIQACAPASYTFEQGYTAFEKKDYKTAEKCFSFLAKKDPKDYKSRMFLAKTYAYEKELDKAINEYKEISKATPDSEFGKSADSSVSMLYSVKYLLEAKEKVAKRTLKDIVKGAKSCEKSKDQAFIKCVFPCDGELIIKKDGTKTMTYPDGETIEETPKGMFNIHNTTGQITTGNVAFTPTENNFRKTCNPEKDGSVYIERNDGTKESHLKNGDVKVTMTSGQELLYTKSGKIEELNK